MSLKDQLHEMNGNVTLVPVGAAPPEVLSWLAGRLIQELGQNVVIGGALSLPGAGHNARRDQYQGDALLTMLRTLGCPTPERVVGLADADCYTPGPNFIFGQATMGGQEALVALARLRQSFYGLPDDAMLFRERVLKEVVHELGHTWGLSPCADPHCAMHFSNTLRDSDVKEAAFCLECRDRLECQRR